MLKHVLVPLDGSQLAEAALSYAKSVVSPGGRISLLTVVGQPDIPFYEFYPTPHVVTQEYDEAMADAVPFARNYLSNIASVALASSTITVDFDVTSGDAAQGIVAAARHLKVDVIVMSTHGRSGLGLWLFGSVTNKVLTTAPCPVLVVPNRQAKQDVTTESPLESVGMH